MALHFALGNWLNHCDNINSVDYIRVHWVEDKQLESKHRTGTNSLVVVNQWF